MRKTPGTSARVIRAGYLLFFVISLLAGGQALAVGLGKMRVLSALDQPLDAEIELISTTPAELNTLEVGLGSRSDFTRAGIERSTLLSLVKFETQVRPNGEAYVRLSTDEPVTEPFLHLLIALEWTGGKLIREYTALLDPPLYAQGRPASVSSPRVAGRQETGREVARGTPSPVRRAVAPPPTSVRTGDLYGPIRRGETLSEVVNRMNLPDGVDVFQAMFSLQRRNPEAFLRGNINLIKEGSTLEIPTAEEMASISKIVASNEYSKQLNEWLAYRNRVAGAQFAASPARTTPMPPAGEPVQSTATEPSAGAATADGQTASGLSEDVLRIIEAEQGGTPAGAGSAAGDGEEIGALRSQLAVMEESLLSTELENRELRERLAMLEEQIKETNKLLRVRDSGLALAEQQAADAPAAAPESEPPADDAEPTPPAAAGDAPRVRVASGESSLFAPVSELMRGDMLWKVLLALAAIVLLIGIVVYIRRRQSYAEFEETMMTGSTYDLRSQSSAFTQVPRMDTMQHSQPSTRADSQSGSLMQTSIMTEMGAPGMGAMQADEVDPVAEAEVYMAYGRDQQAMEVLQDAIRRDPARVELKLKLLEVYQKRKDVRAFESLAEDLYPAIGKDAARWSRVAEMGRRVSPRHPLFAAAPGGSTSGVESSQVSGRARSTLDDDSSGLDLISAPFSRSAQTPAQAPREPGLELPTVGGAMEFDTAPAHDTGGDRDAGIGGNLDLDTDSVSLPFGRDFGAPSGGERATGTSTGGDEVGSFSSQSGQMDDFKASEIATKLDLAKAYLEMGDKEAARGFIEEVLKDGNESQRQQASELASSF